MEGRLLAYLGGSTVLLERLIASFVHPSLFVYNHLLRVGYVGYQTVEK